MPNTLTDASPTENINAVATLLYHVGVSVRMGYGHSESGAYTASFLDDLNSITGERALRTYFKYDKALRSVSHDMVGDSVWKMLIDSELVALRPVIFSGYDTIGGHAFVCDGRDNAGYYHFNWGWGGYCDGYYRIGALNPAPEGGTATYHLNLDNKMIIGVQPDTVLSGNYTITALPDDTLHGSVTGGGIYAYGDTVELTANANVRCRFTYWSDGICYNPRSLIMGGDRTVYAVYDSVYGDTLGYDNGYCASLLGYSTAAPFYWGIKLVPELLGEHTHLDAVQAFLREGTYKVFIYNGAVPADSSMLDTLVYMSMEEGWKTLPFDSALAIDNTLPVWIILYNDDVSYPGCADIYCGHSMASHYNFDAQDWSPGTVYGTFLIRGIFSTMAPPPPVEQVLVEACGSFYWEDSTYTESGTYERLIQDSTGVDSLRVLVLTIHPEFHTFDTVAAVDSFLWVNNQIYTESGVYNFDTVTVYGCDSLLTLVLTITPSQGIEDVQGNGILIYPVPTSGMLYLGEEVESVELYDFAGRLVHLASRTRKLDLSSLPTGAYMLKLLQFDGSVTQHRVVKQ